jgi:uncharacterized delta-60 repeat protein
VSALAGLLFAVSACATDGYYDPAWPGGGRLTFVGDVASPSRDYSASGIVVESSGNLMVWGNTSDSGVLHDSWFAEFSPDGQFVPTFGANDGSGRTTFSHLFANIGIATNAVAIQPDGKYLILTATSEPPLLVRTTAQMHAREASVETQFTISNFQTITAGNAVALTADGKVLVAGVGQYAGGGANRFGVVRLNADLSLDTSFNAGTGGAVIPIVPDDTDEKVTDIFVQPDGRIVLVGSGTNAGANVLEAARLTADGALDSTFNSGGVVAAPWSAGSIYSVGKAALDRSGRIVAPMHGTYDAGAFSITGMLVARLKPNGVPDTDFAATGFSFTASGQCVASEANAIALDAAGRILLVGDCSTTSTGQADFLVERLRGDNGTLDQSFGIHGYGFGAYDATSTYNIANAVAFDRSGRPVVGGFETAANATANSLSGLSRLTYDLIYTNTFETAPRGCLPPDCN